MDRVAQVFSQLFCVGIDHSISSENSVECCVGEADLVDDGSLGELQCFNFLLHNLFCSSNCALVTNTILSKIKGEYEPKTKKGAAGKDEKEPLDEIIAKINERFKGEFTDADRVLLTALRNRLLGDKKLASLAKSADPQIFAESIFPNVFQTAAMDSYMESQETYTSLFEDQHKYNAIMSALADVLYREMRKKK